MSDYDFVKDITERMERIFGVSRPKPARRLNLIIATSKDQFKRHLAGIGRKRNVVNRRFSWIKQLRSKCPSTTTIVVLPGAEKSPLLKEAQIKQIGFPVVFIDTQGKPVDSPIKNKVFRAIEEVLISAFNKALKKKGLI